MLKRSHCDWFLGLHVSGSLLLVSIHLAWPLPLFWIARFRSWHSSRLTPTVRQMEPRGARQRPGRPCQLIWPQAQPYSITTSAVNIQLRVVPALLPAGFFGLLKMTVVLETPRSSQAWWVHVPITALCGRQVSLGTRAGWSCPHPKGSHTTGAVRENARSSCHLSDCQADLIGLVGVPFFDIAPESFKSMHVTFPEKEERSCLSCQAHLFFCIQKLI